MNFPERIERDGRSWVRVRLFRSYGPCCMNYQRTAPGVHPQPQAEFVGAEYVEEPQEREPV